MEVDAYCLLFRALSEGQSAVSDLEILPRRWSLGDDMEGALAFHNGEPAGAESKI